MRKSLFLLFSVLLTISFGCQKDILEGAWMEEISPEFGMTLAKDHYKKLSSMGTNGHHAMANAELLWSKAYQAQQKDMDFIEVPLTAKKWRVRLYNFPKDSLKYEPDESVAKGTIQRLLLFKREAGDIETRILMYIPDKEYLLERRGNISDNSLKSMKSSFSGYLEYRTWDMKVLRILRIKNGKVERRYKPCNCKEKLNTKL